MLVRASYDSRARHDSRRSAAELPILLLHLDPSQDTGAKRSGFSGDGLEGVHSWAAVLSSLEFHAQLCIRVVGIPSVRVRRFIDESTREEMCIAGFDQHVAR